SSIAPIREKFQVVTSDMFAACCGSSASPLDATAVQAAAAAALSAYDPPTYAELEARTLPTASYATASALSTVDSNVDDIKAVTDNLPDSGALSSLATAAALAVVDGNVDSIKAKTDQLTFSVSGQVDANMQSINDGEIVGDGVGTPFDIASN